MSKQRLGRGLDALFSMDGGVSAEDTELNVALELIDPNPHQPRREFDQGKLDELAESIRVHGVIQPVILRRMRDRYQLVAGERRCRAARLAGLKEVPAAVKDFTDLQMLELAIVENLQRDDLDAMEEAAAYQQLLERLNLTQEQVAARVGKSRSHVANTLRLLQLPELLQQYVSRETLTAGHARAILGLPTVRQQLEAAEKAVRLGLNVRQTEQLIKAIQSGNVSRETKSPGKGQATDIERQLQSSLGTSVKVVRGRKHGRIEIAFFSADELERLLDLLLQ